MPNQLLWISFILSAYLGSGYCLQSRCNFVKNWRFQSTPLRIRPFSQFEAASTISNTRRSRLNGVWGNYSSDGKREGQLALVVALLIVLKGAFTSVEVRTTYICPSGSGAEKRLKVKPSLNN